MNRFLFIPIFILVIHLPVYAGKTSEKDKYDSVSIGYIPARGAYFKGEPMKSLVAKSSSRHINPEIENFFNSLNALATGGVKDNATRFHQPAIYLDVVYKGKRARLFYRGDSNLEKYSDYERQWKELHNRMFKYLTREMTPPIKVN